MRWENRLSIQINLAKCAGLWLAILFTLVPTNSSSASQLNSMHAGYVEAADPFANYAVIEEGDLAEMRGGLSIAGLNLSFGAIAKTVIDNVMLQTVFSITEVGAAIVSQMLSDTTGSATPILVGANTGISVTDIAPANTDLSGFADASGVVIKDSNGFTAALHKITRDAILSTLVSTKSNQQIEHKVNIQIEIQGAKNAYAASLRSSIINSVQNRLR